MAQGMKEPQKEDLFRYDYGRPIKELIEEKGGLQNVVLDLFSKFCKGEYVNYLENEQVQKLVEWFEKNSSHVQKNIENMIKNGKVEGDLKTEEQVYYAIGFMVGGQYALGNYTDYDEEVDERKVELYCSGSDAKWLDGKTISIGIPRYDKKPKENSAFIGFLRGLNAGIHEYAHGLRKFNGVDNEPISELGVSFVSRDLTVPIYYKDLASVLYGMRDPLRLVEQIRDKKVGLSYADVINKEDFSFMMEPWITAYFEKDGGEIPKGFVLDCIYVNHGGYIPLNQVYHKNSVFRPEEYVKNIPNEEVQKIVLGVLEKLMKETWSSPKEFFEKLFDALDNGFGCRPSPMEAPDGFVYFMPKEREKRNAFMG